MVGRVDDIVRAVMRALDDTASTASHSLDDPGFHGPLLPRTHATIDGTMDFEPPRTSLTQRKVRAAVEQAMRATRDDVDYRTGQPTNAGFHGSLDPRDFFGI